MQNQLYTFFSIEFPAKTTIMLYISLPFSKITHIIMFFLCVCVCVCVVLPTSNTSVGENVCV